MLSECPLNLVPAIINIYQKVRNLLVIHNWIYTVSLDGESAQKLSNKNA